MLILRGKLAILQKTLSAFDKVMESCRTLFKKKLDDYGTSWRILRPLSLTDQIFIKARRLRSIEEKEVQKINESPSEDLKAIINYGLIALIQLKKEFSKDTELSLQEALDDYDREAEKVKALMINKNHDYGEAWRDMRRSSMTDMILQKILRLRQIEDKKINPSVSEGPEGHYMDIINYAIFALILEGVSSTKKLSS
ncbi:DUF1599 domain-containing protein [Bacteroidetes bacterium endosymbiont of Geopemphigus sp.]|uniref:DUF1599 domain-containing protein n=1 Tax=Bacteroidetes bacterium endosymbiont of Geopemphigus sp. TaxID=2047937 RepID=UPI000CD102F7|nr:DUF1599 domain-containing protein [Bacteroidetes bacterium endosymbiont of Geopemphigus sp.]